MVNHVIIDVLLIAAVIGLYIQTSFWKRISETHNQKQQSINKHSKPNTSVNKTTQKFHFLYMEWTL